MKEPSKHRKPRHTGTLLLLAVLVVLASPLTAADESEPTGASEEKPGPTTEAETPASAPDSEGTPDESAPPEEVDSETAKDTESESEPSSGEGLPSAPEESAEPEAEDVSVEKEKPAEEAEDDPVTRTIGQPIPEGLTGDLMVSVYAEGMIKEALLSGPGQDAKNVLGGAVGGLGFHFRNDALRVLALVRNTVVTTTAGNYGEALLMPSKQGTSVILEARAFRIPRLAGIDYVGFLNMLGAYAYFNGAQSTWTTSDKTDVFNGVADAADDAPALPVLSNDAFPVALGFGGSLVLCPRPEVANSNELMFALDLGITARWLAGRAGEKGVVEHYWWDVAVNRDAKNIGPLDKRFFFGFEAGVELHINGVKAKFSFPVFPASPGIGGLTGGRPVIDFSVMLDVVKILSTPFRDLLR